ncbi:hypothetical protein EDD29_4173 [Actinocorallia herbida]|uniref:Uncharacterized protein n=1 Tax=Actinocorallia herbida TaxID=58109 RepID=A0A3N1CZ82_9ACTN|nr:hypothetical protein [Actinocorallia herbida]ROO86600.1 hypothetical protein EDD29_4173 [Actinocorallia herbida]
MPDADALLRRIEATPELAELLAWPADFDLARRDPVEELRLPSGLALTPVAGDGAGGTFFLCGPDGAIRPVLYADSEGQAALIAADLPEAVALVAAHPYWRDLLHGHPAAELEAEFADDDPDFPETRARLLALLEVDPPSAEDALARLRAAVARTVPDFVPFATHPEGKTSYELL